MIQTLMASCHRFSRGMKYGSTILNLNPSGNWWNGSTQHPRQRKKFKTALSAGKIVAAVCWDEKCVAVLNFLHRGTAVNCYWSKEMLRVRRLTVIKFVRQMSEVLLFSSDDARPYPSVDTTEAIKIWIDSVTILIVQS